MNYPNSNSISRPLSAAFLALALCCALASCKKEKQEYVHKKYDPEFVPTIDTDSVTMKISDSGRVKYKMVTKRMQIFDKAKDPHWFFPHALYLEQYDSAFHVNSTIQADTAWNYTRRGVWRLKGHVVIKNVKGSIFKTEELFWDQNQQKVYTDKFIKITTPDRNLKGYGMDASQDLTSYQIRRPSGTMNMKEEGL